MRLRSYGTLFIVKIAIQWSDSIYASPIFQEDYRMFRSLALFCLATVCIFSAVFAQEAPTKPDSIKATPEILSLFHESLQSLTPAEPNLRAGGLFQLLGFGINFDDQVPARKIIEALLVLAPSVEPEELRNQLYEGVANALCDLEDCAEAVGILNRIVKSADRYERQLNLAIKIVREHENDTTLKPFDASELLRQAVAGAVEAKDVHLEAAARIFLGRELARQGKQAESVAAFAEAMRIAQKIEDVAEQSDTIGVLLQSQVQYGQMDNVLTTLQTVSNPELKRLCVVMLIRHEKYDDAEKLLKTLPADEMRDVLLHSFVIATIQTITEETIGELASLVSSDEQRERFLQRIVAELQKNDRGDTAVQMGKRVKDPANANLALLLGKIESFLGKKQFTEAVQCIDQSEEEDAIRQHLKRQILMMQYRETFEESVAQQIVETYTGGEKMSMAELNEAAKQAAQISDHAERMDVFLEILQEQFQLMDLAGARQTMKLVSEQLDKDTDPVRIVQYRLLLARLLVAMGEKQGTKENLGKLMQMLSAVKDLKVLKDLAPEQTPAVTEAGRIKLDLPVAGGESTVDEAAIHDQLFQIYLMTASLLTKADAPTESKAAFEKAKELANVEPVAEQKAEKLLILAQFLAEDLN